MSLSGITSAVNGLSNLVVAVPQLVNSIKGGGYQPEPPPVQKNVFYNLFVGSPALLFHYEGEQIATLKSDITDHFNESNIAIQDHIALKPETVITHGFIGELNDVLPPALAALKLIANKLTFIPGFPPSLSLSALVALNNAILLYETAQNTVGAISAAYNSAFGSTDTIIGSEGIVGGFNPANLNSPLNAANPQTKQQQYFTQFYGYWKSRTLFTIYTPWAFFQHMAIESLRVIQDADTRMMSDFEITFKMIRFASNQSSSASFTGSRLLNSDLASNPVQAGSTNPANTSTTLSSQIP